MLVSLVVRVLRFRRLAHLSRWRTLGFLAHAIDQSQEILLIRTWLLLLNPSPPPVFCAAMRSLPGAFLRPRRHHLEQLFQRVQRRFDVRAPDWAGLRPFLPEASSTTGPFSPQVELT